MKRLIPLLLVLVLLLAGCGNGLHTFKGAENGYVDIDSDRCYVMLDMAYESKAYSNEYGVYENEAYQSTKSFFEIPKMDPTLYLTDAYGNVYYAGDVPIDASEWELSMILFCQEEMISIEEFRFAASDAAQTVQRLRDLWFEGERAEMPLAAAKNVYAVKLMTADLANVCYGLQFLAYEDGNAYLCDKQRDRAVQLPADLAATILAKGG